MFIVQGNINDEIECKGRPLILQYNSFLNPTDENKEGERLT